MSDAELGLRRPTVGSSPYPQPLLHRGRDQVAVFDEELRTTAVSRLATERMVRRALDAGRIVVEYQPIVDVRTGYPVGAEALVRIRDLEQRLMVPGSFLEVAEETGWLIKLNEVVLVDAVKQAAAWRARLGAKFAGVAINVTARHLADSEFRHAIFDQLEANGVPPGDLQIEVTEQVLMEASNSAMTGLRARRDLGVVVGLDDFGTRYSSLAYLRQFPLDFVKIDKSFVDDVVIDRKVRAIAGAIIVLAHALDLTVVAEGVELAGQAQVLMDLGCDRAQGLLYGRSGPPKRSKAQSSPGPRHPYRPSSLQPARLLANTGPESDSGPAGGLVHDVVESGDRSVLRRKFAAGRTRL